MLPAEAIALPVSLPKGIREVHDTPQVATMLEAIGMTELVDYFFDGALLEKLWIGRLVPKLRVQACEGDDGGLAVDLSLAEDEVEAGCKEVEVCDAKDSLSLRVKKGEFFKNWAGLVLSSCW